MAAPADSLRTPLYDWHRANGARVVDFAGWAMPVQYESIIAEHLATRKAIGLFDVSHMGRIRMSGPDVVPFLDRMLTRRVTDLRPWRARYSFLCNESGGILDDVLIYRLGEGASGPTAGPPWQLIVNASNRPKLMRWLTRHQEDFELSLEDATLSTAMIAVQGPQSVAIVAKFCEDAPADLRYFQVMSTKVCGVAGYLSRTGYTGEDGCEFVCDADAAEGVWRQLVEAARKEGGCPVGLGARDTLRLEAALPLYGHELSEEVNPIQTGLPFAYDLEGREFIGSQAIARRQGDPTLPVRVGLELLGRRPARERSQIFHDGTRVGAVTSGTFSPSLERPIALAYVHRPAAALGTHVVVDIRGQEEPAQVVSLPFYRRAG